MVHFCRLLILSLAIASVGCTTWGYKTPTGAVQYPRTDYRMVQVLFESPDPATYDQIGFCSVLGGAAFITPDTDMLRKLQKAAADLGADAVILRKETTSFGASGSAAAFGAHDYPQNSGIAIKWKNSARRLQPL